MAQSYSYHEMTQHRDNYREVFRLQGNYTLDGITDRYPIILFQSLLEPWILVLHIEFGEDATRRYSNLSPHKARNPNTGHVFHDGQSFGDFSAFAQHLLSYELFYQNRNIDRDKAMRLLYYVFRNHLFFGEKLDSSRLLLE